MRTVIKLRNCILFVVRRSDTGDMCKDKEDEQWFSWMRLDLLKYSSGT